MRRVISIAKQVAWYLGVAAIGFLLGVVSLYVFWVRSGPALQTWHTAELAAEFSLDNTPQVTSFEEYQGLEERLFAQLESEVLARSESGPEFELARYSPGSAADPHAREPNWNRSFELATDSPAGGVLLLHGMSDSPYSFRALAESLNQRGYWVLALRLPGHGTIPAGLKAVQWEDMAAAVRMGAAHLAARTGGAALHLVGYSTGAPLALDYALDVLQGEDLPAPASLVLISPAIAITPAAVLADWKARLSAIPGLEKLAWTQILPEFDPYKYNSFTTNAAVQVHRLTRAVARRTGALASSAPIRDFPPTLVFLSTVDATVSTTAVIDNLLDRLEPGDHELVLFDINRNAAASTILIADPAPLTDRLLADDELPFGLTLIINESSGSRRVISRRKPPLSRRIVTEPLELAWPAGVISLSHVALPVPPDDPLYGRRDAPAADRRLQLGQIEVQGERGLLLVPADWLLRLRYNPFYDYLEERLLAWVARDR